MKKNIIITTVIFLLSLFASIFAMSDDGGQDPVNPEKKNGALQVQQEQTQLAVKEVSNEATANEKQDNSVPEKSDLERYKSWMEEKISKKIIAHKDKDGNAVDEEDQILVPVERIVKDGAGNEIVLDGWLKNTGLSIEEFTKHKSEYSIRKSSILIEKGYKTLPWFVAGWYDNRINLNKLNELQAAGYEVFHDIGGGECNSFEGHAMTAEAVIVGEVVKYERMDINTGFNSKLKISIDEIIKGSEFIKEGEILEIGRSSGISGYKQVPMNTKGIILLMKTTNEDRVKYYPIMYSKFWEIKNGNVIGDPRLNGKNDSISLAEFKKRVKELIRINDADNFYKRSWKEAQK